MTKDAAANHRRLRRFITRTQASGSSARHGGVMPQLDFADYAPQLVWLVITFGIMYLLMARVALPRIATVIEERRDRIANDLAQAEQLRRETDEAIAAYEKALADAKARANAIAQETRDRLNEELAQERQQKEAEINERLERAEQEIAKTKEQALAHVEEIARDTTAALVEQLLGEKVSDQALESAVSRATSKHGVA
ncbi:F0F1 ATP synthase subunit B [Dichotomicrobium thermohalophilum]|uniref:F0F1 ATP synthase subunit B n=1 Tax=Dichotomicrobium thermohalophilum TaxID=933063 RepID=UPI000E5BAE05|nr:F0F1 ATP synthase subunit B [Dichotomicrobium thermohalophilum]